MAQRADDIRHDIADTRAAMTEQLAMLEARVLGDRRWHLHLGGEDDGGGWGYRGAGTWGIGGEC